MKKNLLLISLMLFTALATNAQQKVQQFFSVSDPTFNVNFGKSTNPLRNPDGTFIYEEGGYPDGKVKRGEVMDNSSNPLTNSFTLTTEWSTAAWEFGGPFWEPGTDWSKYDKLVIRLSSVVGNNLTLSIWDYASMNTGNSPDDQFTCPDDIVEFDEEQEFVFDLKEGLERRNGNGVLDLTNIKHIRFWNYWDVHGEQINPDEKNYDPTFVDVNPGPEVTVTIAAMYLERTLANGEKDYLNLLEGNTLQFTDSDFEPEEGTEYVKSYMDNTGVLHVQENVEAGIYFDDQPADWSDYKYLVIVPQKPWNGPVDENDPTPDDPILTYKLTDTWDITFDSGAFRWFTWNRPRAAVQDLTAIATTEMDPVDEVPQFAEGFDTKHISSLRICRWGGVSSWEYGIAGMWLSNTCPTFSTRAGLDTDNTGDFIIENASENNVMTICLPFAAALCGAQVYTIAGIDNPAEPAEIYAKPYTGILEAGKPYIIKTNCARNVTAFRAGANEVVSPADNGALVADNFMTYYVEADKNYLTLNEDGEFEAVVEDDIRLNSNTAYIDCSKLAKAEEQENGLVFAVKGAKPFEANGISEMVNSKLSNSKYTFDLSGRKVNHPVKGIYVKNGIKVVIK